MRHVLMCLSLLCVVALTGSASVAQPRGGGDLIVLAATPVPMATTLFQSPRTFALQPAGYSCRRDCRDCRTQCAVRWRQGCHRSWCRTRFVECMRGCWYEICRRCG